jgi:hypothetical protein
MNSIRKAALLLPLLGACGKGAGADDQQPYATLRGAVSSSNVQTTSEVRVALVWEHVGPQKGATALKSAQELGLHAQFPASFQMDVTQLPPTEALSQIDPAVATQTGLDPKLRIGAGTLVVYEDTNGNGKLDLVSLTSTSTIDRVLGVPQGLTVVYVEGTPPPPASKGFFLNVTLQRGFNLLQEPNWKTAGGAPSLSGDAWTVLPLSTEIPIALTAAPQLSHYVCQQDPGLIDKCGSTPPSTPGAPQPTSSPNCGDDPTSAPTPTPTPTPTSHQDGGASDAGDFTPPCCKTMVSNDTPPTNPSPGVNGAGRAECSPEGFAASPCSQANCIFTMTGSGTPGTTNGPGNGGGAGTPGGPPP